MRREEATVVGPLDGIALVPQLRRLPAELMAPAVRPAVHEAVLSVISRRASTVHQGLVIGVRSRAWYHGMALFRELDAGTWEVASLRLRRREDDETPISLLNAAAVELPERDGRRLVCRALSWEGAERLLRRAGFTISSRELSFAVRPDTTSAGRPMFRTAGKSDLHDIFRLYCRLVPAAVRQQEAPVLDDFAAIRASYGIVREFVAGEPGALQAWIAIGQRGARLICQPGPLAEDALSVIERTTPVVRTLVVPDYAEHLLGFVSARGYPVIDSHLIASRKLVRMQPLAEGAAAHVPAAYTNY